MEIVALALRICSQKTRETEIERDIWALAGIWPTALLADLMVLGQGAKHLKSFRGHGNNTPKSNNHVGERSI